jgi:hypothetical protein
MIDGCGIFLRCYKGDLVSATFRDSPMEMIESWVVA